MSYKSPEQALKDSGLDMLGPSKVQDFTVGPAIDVLALPRHERVQLLGEELVALLEREPPQPLEPVELVVLSVNHATGEIVVGSK